RDDCPQTFSVRRRYEIVNDIDVRVIFARGLCFAWKFFRTKRRRKENKRDRRSELHFAPAALTTFCAASARSSAGINSTPLFFKSCFPFSTFVPSSLTTTGTERFTVFAALIIPCAITSTFMMPPKMRVVIEIEFCIEREHVALLRHHQRIDFHHRTIATDERSIKPIEQFHCPLCLRLLESELLREFARLKWLEAGQRIDWFANNFVRRFGRNGFDLHATFSAGHNQRRSDGAI